MDHLLLFPPVWPPAAPHLALPSIIAQLKKENFDAEAIDLNIEIYNDILTKQYLTTSIKKLNKIKNKVQAQAKKYDINKLNEYPIEIKEILLKNKHIQQYLEKKSYLLETIPNLVEKAVANIKNPEYFYDLKYFTDSIKIIHLALEIASLPYAPAKFTFFQYFNELAKYDYNNIKYNVFSKSTNIFIEYYEKWIKIIKKKKPKFIGISIGTNCQLNAGLTLANLLKTNTDAHICIGGNFFTRIYDDIIDHPEFFDLFADSISINEGETPIVELVKYINNEIPIEKVPNLIYKKNNQVIINEKCKALSINETDPPNYDDYNFSKYLTPQMVLPIQISRGCYWGKCSFCDLPYGAKFSIKDVDKIIEELKTYKEKYNISLFGVIDESVSPAYLEKMSEKIIKNKLDINYHCCCRTENLFSPELFEKVRKSGLRKILWGLEAGSDRIMQLINKGIDPNKRIKILKDSYYADIWNHGYIFYGFPTETIDEAKETISMLLENSEFINSVGLTGFKLVKFSKISENPEKYGIRIIENEKKQEFATLLDYEEEGMTQEGRKTVTNLFQKAMKKTYNYSFWNYSTTQEYLFLYIIHYGLDWVKNCKYNSENGN